MSLRLWPALLVALICAQTATFASDAIASNAIWTSTREVRALAVAPGGVIWAATTGGIVRFDGKKWRKWTRRDGLPSHEAGNIAVQGSSISATFPRARATWDTRAQRWHSKPTSPASPRKIAASWLGKTAVADLSGVHWNGIVLAPPQGGGTHVSALLTDGKVLLAALYEDGLWRIEQNARGLIWRHDPNLVPANAREITALAGNSRDLWLGTRRDGIFRRKAGKWTHIPPPDEPVQHNAQALLHWNNALWMATLEDGLVARTAAGWKHFGEPELSSNAARHLVAFRGALYVRHGGGTVDKYDGARWTKNVFATLPRKGIYALAVGANRLLCAGWGGWSEWNGATWTHHFDIAELRGIPLMGALPDGDKVWIATQSRGVGLWQRTDDTFRWLDERDGLADDWITTLTRVGPTVYAGTFVDGLARYDGARWSHFAALAGDNVTALQADGATALWIATRRGLWHLEGETLRKITIPWLDDEVQTLATTPDGLWVGTRTSLNFCTRASLLPASLLPAS